MGWPSSDHFRRAACAWAAGRRDAAGRPFILVLAQDGGPTSSGSTSEDDALSGVCCAVTRSGPRWKADDTIERDALWWLDRGCDVVVITSDKLLRSRCRQLKRASGRGLRVVESEVFVNELGPFWRSRPGSKQVQRESKYQQHVCLVADFVEYVNGCPRPQHSTKSFKVVRQPNRAMHRPARKKR